MRINPCNLIGPGVVDLNFKPLGDYAGSDDVLNAPVVLLRNCKIGGEEEVMGYFQSATFRDKRLTCMLQDPNFTGLPMRDPANEPGGGGDLMKLQDFIRDYYMKEGGTERLPGKTFYGIGLRVEDHRLLGKMDAELKRHKLGSASPISGVISDLTRKKLNPSYRGINVPEVLIKLDGAWTGGHTEYLGVRAANVQVHGNGGEYLDLPH